jgi:hypothetical protein
MTNKIVAINDSAKNKKVEQTWSQTIRKGDVTKRVEVTCLDNGGYLVSINVYGHKGEGDKREYFDTTKRLYSETNPFDIEEEKDAVDVLLENLIKK